MSSIDRGFPFPWVAFTKRDRIGCAPCYRQRIPTHLHLALWTHLRHSASQLFTPHFYGTHLALARFEGRPDSLVLLVGDRSDSINLSDWVDVQLVGAASSSTLNCFLGGPSTLRPEVEVPTKYHKMKYRISVLCVMLELLKLRSSKSTIKV